MTMLKSTRVTTSKDNIDIDDTDFHEPKGKRANASAGIALLLHYLKLKWSTTVKGPWCQTLQNVVSGQYTGYICGYYIKAWVADVEIERFPYRNTPNEQMVYYISALKVNKNPD